MEILGQNSKIELIACIKVRFISSIVQQIPSDLTSILRAATACWRIRRSQDRAVIPAASAFPPDFDP
jgi:hypothetical protein